MGYEANRRVETSARTFAIVERLSTAGQMGVSSLADELDMSKGIVHNHLSTLRELGYVRKAKGQYQLTPRLPRVGLRARSNTELYRVADGLCSEFADQLDTRVVLCSHSDTDCTVVEHYGQSAADIGIGTTFPPADSLVGLVGRLADRGDEAPAQETNTYDIAALRRSLETAGYVTGPLSPAYDDYCVAVPILMEADCHGCVGVLLAEGEREGRLGRVTEAATTLRDRIEQRFDSGWTGERSFATEKHSWTG
jgi:DNA-binding IclR family transcriptional regulator